MLQYQITKLIKELSSVNSKSTIYGNTQTSSKIHSNEVKVILERYGFRDQTKSGYHNLIYKEQPNGTQSFPDFFLLNKNKTLNFELKRSNSNTIMWNDGFPKAGTLYLISCRDFTRLCMGDRLRTNKDLEKYEKICHEIKDLNNKFKKDSSFTFFTRKAISQKIGPSTNHDFLDCYKILSFLINE